MQLQERRCFDNGSADELCQTSNDDTCQMFGSAMTQQPKAQDAQETHRQIFADLSATVPIEAAWLESL